MKGVNTTLPGYFLSFDPDTQLAQIQIALQLIDSKKQNFKAPPLVEVPVYFPSGGDFSLEIEVTNGAEGIVIFSQRCIDAWMDQGGDAIQAIQRQFDMSDAMFLPGMKSQPNKMADFQNNGIRLRNKDATNYIWLKNDGTAEIKGNLTVVGDIESTTKIEAPSVIANDKELAEHTHPAGSPPGNTGVNNS